MTAASIHPAASWPSVAQARGKGTGGWGAGSAEQLPPPACVHSTVAMASFSRPGSRSPEKPSAERNAKVAQRAPAPLCAPRCRCIPQQAGGRAGEQGRQPASAAEPSPAGEVNSLLPALPPRSGHVLQSILGAGQLCWLCSWSLSRRWRRKRRPRGASLNLGGQLQRANACGQVAPQGTGGAGRVDPPWANADLVCGGRGKGAAGGGLGAVGSPLTGVHSQCFRQGSFPALLGEGRDGPEAFWQGLDSRRPLSSHTAPLPAPSGEAWRSASAGQDPYMAGLGRADLLPGGGGGVRCSLPPAATLAEQTGFQALWLCGAEHRWAQGGELDGELVRPFCTGEKWRCSGREGLPSSGCSPLEGGEKASLPFTASGDTAALRFSCPWSVALPLTPLQSASRWSLAMS